MGCLCRTDEHETDCGYGISRTGAAGWFNCGRENCNWCPRPSEKGHPRIPTEADLAAQAELMMEKPDDQWSPEAIQQWLALEVINKLTGVMTGVTPTAAIVHPDDAAELQRGFIKQLGAKLISGLKDLL